MVAHMLKEVTEEVTSFLSGLIKINTTNPPGNEIKAAKYVAEDLKKDGFKCDLYESSPGRGSVVTRLKGTGEKPSLLLLSHLDVVAANPKEWSVDPFSGLVEDGFVWGRGALDMKGMTAVEAMALKLLKRNKMKLKGDIILAATADEEKGGEAGAGWLVQNHLDKVKADYVLNEGGGTAIPVNGKTVYTIQTAEKGILWFTVQGGNFVGRLDPRTGAIRLKRSPTPNSRPYGIVVNPKGIPFFCEFGTNKLASINPETMEITEYLLPEGARPRRLAVGSGDRVYYTDFARGYLGRLDPNERRIEEWASPGGSDSHPYAIAATPDGAPWYSESGKKPNTIVRFDPGSRTFTRWPIPSGGGVVRHMVATPGGDLYIACSGVNKVGVVKVEP